MSLPTVTPCAKSLLDFIAIGESRGNYNAVIDDAASTTNLALLTIAGIFAKQAALLAQGAPSSAIGRYQFVHQTLVGLVRTAGLAANILFTNDLQDMLAMVLLEQRGYAAWLAKALSDEGFAHNLSYEWASLPDPDNDGKSHYDGDGVNHSGQTLAAVYAAFAKARAA